MPTMTDSKRNEPAMDDAQAQDDRHGFQTSVEMVTGRGHVAMFDAGAGQEVGNQYDYDPLGEEYKPVTYGGSEPMFPGKVGGAATNALQKQRSSGGREVATAPQNYSKYGKE